MKDTFSWRTDPKDDTDSCMYSNITAVGMDHSEFLILNSELNLRWGLIIKSWKNLAKIRRSCGQYVAKI